MFESESVHKTKYKHQFSVTFKELDVLIPIKTSQLSILSSIWQFVVFGVQSMTKTYS